MPEFLIPYSEQIVGVYIGDEPVEIPLKGLPINTDALPGTTSWTITLTSGRHISIEKGWGIANIFIPHQKTVTYDGFTRLLGTDRGRQGCN